MSLEAALAANTAALEALAAVMKGGVPAAAGKAETKSAKPEPKGYTAKHTKEEMLAAMNEVKEKIDAATAKGIRDEVGKVAKLAEITDPETIDKVYDAAKKALTKAEEEV